MNLLFGTFSLVILATAASVAQGASIPNVNLLARSPNTTAAAPPLNPVPCWNYGGCFKDLVNGQRVLPSRSGPNNETIEGCIDACNKESQGYTVAGLEYYSECFCGFDIPSSPKLSDDRCNFTCEGNINEPCGGDAALGIWYFECPTSTTTASTTATSTIDTSTTSYTDTETASTSSTSSSVDTTTTTSSTSSSTVVTSTVVTSTSTSSTITPTTCSTVVTSTSTSSTIIPTTSSTVVTSTLTSSTSTSSTTSSTSSPTPTFVPSNTKYINFYKDNSIVADPNIALSDLIHANYDIDRVLPSCGATVNTPNTQVYAYYSINNGPVVTQKLVDTNPRPILRNQDILIQPPSGPGDLAFWFACVVNNGSPKYDSNYSKNYHFTINGAQLSFDSKFSTATLGSLKASEPVWIKYDVARVGKVCGAGAVGDNTLTVQAFWRFNSGSTSQATIFANGVQNPVVIPSGSSVAGTLAVWFYCKTASASGYDSNFGANWNFGVSA
ncbi:hypothetical protein HDU76_001502 [Blyttiomyces sp. JEL0837]|nr:hypothetical protein HDU76_001502 [Blyttiomyces sp. JEL0837]